jgi:hypothetical protein
MGKKIEDAEVKKECPSCGLGVALDSTVCEFCGWDFEEEDEWILQIEKLERELMLEKQRFEPGSVNHKIESTLHAPHVEREKAKAGEEPAADEKPSPVAKAPVPKPERAEPAAKPARQVVAKPQKAVPPTPAPVPRPEPSKPVQVQRVEKAPVAEHAPEPAVRTVKPPEPPASAPAGAKTRKVRVVRKVKQ